MDNKSINSYNNPIRVAEYEADMDIMHPNRIKMIDIALEILPYEEDTSFTSLELGSGTGYFTKRFLEKFKNSNIIAVEGADSMIEVAEERLGELTERIDFRVGNFLNLKNLISENEMGNVVFTSYSLHHLNKDEKLNVIKMVKDFLLSGGWFINADLIKPNNIEIEKRIRNIRIDGIVKRGRGIDKKFKDHSTVGKFIEDLETNEKDQPITIQEDLDILSSAGLQNPSIFWLEYREAVYGAVKQTF